MMPMSDPTARPDSEMVISPTGTMIAPAALYAMPIDSPKMSAAIRMLRLFRKSTRFSMRLRTPTAEIMPYKMIDTPPMTLAGIAPMTAANFGQNENSMAKTAAMRTTRGSNTLVSASTPVFSPYVVFAGAPNSDARMVATPSPSNVRCKPGSAM